MWFEDDDLFGKRFAWAREKHSRRNARHLNVRLDAGRNTNLQHAAMVFIGIALLAALAGALWYGALQTFRVLFSRNDLFNLKTLTVTSGGVMTRERVMEYTQIREGMNLFSLDIGRIRGEFLKSVPSVKAMDISRILPDTLKIDVVERVPLACVGRRGYLVADREGWLFGLRSGTAAMPVVTGCRGNDLKPGGRLEGMAVAALQVIEACDNPVLGIRIESVDAGRGDRLVLMLTDGRAVELAWEKMCDVTPESRKTMVQKLARLSSVLQSDEGRKKARIDATFDSKIFGR